MARCRSTALLAALAFAASAGCTTARYIGPDAKDTQTARVVLRHPPDDSTSDVGAGVYASNHNCDRSLGRMSPGYRGELDLDPPEQEIRVGTIRPVFFRFTYYAGARTPKVCWVGFRARADESYVLEYSLDGLRACNAAVSSPQGPVELLSTASCAEGEL